MRVHYDKNLIRRNLKGKTNYSQYEDDIKKDFQNICGYCGKSERCTSKGFEIDHFIPQSKAPNLVNEYSNLAYSCYTCNRKKLNKWPTNDTTIHFTDKLGIIDPCDKAFDEHIERNLKGEIVGKSILGEYICNKVFKFNTRPMSTIHRLHEIHNEMDRIIEMDKKREVGFSSKLIIKLKELESVIFNKKE